MAEIGNLDELKKNSVALPGPKKIWSPAIQAAFAPPQNVTVSQWAEMYRVLPKSSAVPGQWSNRLAPYAVGVMDAFNDPWVERITIMASVQSAKTESVYNMLGWAVCQDPAPAVIVMPTLNTMKRVNRRIRKMFMVSDELAQHLTGNPDDLQLHQIILDRMEIYFATAGSDADLQNIEARYVICDETDEYQMTAETGDLVEKAIDRSTTYWNRKIVLVSRPTAADNYITRSYEQSDRRKYWVPCPFCGGFQVLSFWQIKHRGGKLGEWPQDKRSPDYIRLNRVARYECVHCGGEIDDRHKQEMLLRGRWAPGPWLPWQNEGKPDRPETSCVPKVTHAGFWWNAIYSQFLTFSEIAARFFQVKNDPKQYQTFVNQVLAEPWQEVVESQPASHILQLRTRRPALVVPEETLALTAGIDSQRRGFWVVIRAWVLTPEGLRESHKIRHGFVESFGELERWLFEDVYRSEISQREYQVWRGFIDTGGGLMGEGEATLTEQVYNWLRRSGRGRIFGSKGSSKPLNGRLWVRSTIEHFPSGKPLPGGLVLYRLDTAELKEFIFARIKNGLFHLDGGPNLSFEEDKIPEADRIYAAHMSAEIKERRRGKVVWTVQRGRENHLLDCEVMAAAAAEAFNVWLLPRPQEQQSMNNMVPDRIVNPFTGRPPGAWLRR